MFQVGKSLNDRSAQAPRLMPSRGRCPSINISHKEARVEDVHYYHALRQSLCDWSIEYSGHGHIDSVGCTGPDKSPPTTTGHLLWDKKNGGAPGGHGDPFSFRTNNPEPYAVSEQVQPIGTRRHFPLGF